MEKNRFYKLFFYLIFLPAWVQAQERGHSASALRIGSENDYYKMRDATDRYYTNGLTIEFQPESNPQKTRLKSTFPSLRYIPSAETILRWALNVQAYTPENIYDLGGQQQSRPYCGLAMFSLSGISNSASKQERLTTSFSVGMIGPATMQKEMQYWYHRKTGRKLPVGWENQIANDLILNAVLLYEKKIWSPVSYLEFNGMAEGNCGSLMNFAGLGLQCRFGFLNNYFRDVLGLSQRRPPKNNFSADHPTASSQRRFQFYFFGKSTGRVVYDNSLLEAGYFNFKNSTYKLGKEQIENFYAQFEFGYVLAARHFSLSFSQVYRTAEFKTAKPAHWGNITFTCRL